MTQQSICRNQTCVTELIFTDVQYQTHAQWIYSKTLTKGRDYKTEWFTETKIYT